MNQRTFSPGFRFSRRDAVVLVVGAIGSVVFGMSVPWFGVMVAAVVLHFFLFCNVFRLPRFLELIWAAVFLLASASVLVRGTPNWQVWLAMVCAATTGVVFLSMRRPSYHGIFWQTINPDLPSWWHAQQQPNGNE